MVKRTVFSLGAVAFGLLLAFLLIEGTMRLIAWQQTQPADLLYSSHPSNMNYDKNEFRIICLGESTTAPVKFNSRNVAWPAALEEKLNKLRLGRTFRTFTIAYHGTSTPFLLQELGERLDSLKPHLVISMMGINDISSLEYLQREDSISKLRTIKLANWLIQSLRQRFRPEVSPTESHDIYRSILNLPPGPRQNAGREMPNIQSSKGLHLFLEHIEKFAQSRPQRQRYFVYQIATLGLLNLFNLNEIEHELAPALSGEIQSAAIEMNRKWLTHFPGDMLGVRFFLYTTNRRQDLQSERIYRIHQGLDNGGQLDNTLMSLIGGYADSRIREEIQKFGIQLDHSETPLSKTRNNYWHLANMLKNRNIQYMAMQYPTASITPLRTIFSNQKSKMNSYGDFISAPDIVGPVSPGFRHIIFVSNENFRNIVTPTNEAEYFTDMFATNRNLRFGHTTQKGHDLIADNIAQVFTEHWHDLKANPLIAQ